MGDARDSWVIDLLDQPRQERLQAYEQILAAARNMGFQGFGGQCFGAAVAINRILFAGHGEYVLGLNAAFERHDQLVGHAAVRIDDEVYECVNLDVDGRMKADDEITSWGMLDHEDPDYRRRARALGLAWNEDTASDARMFEVDEAELVAHADDGMLARLSGILRQAVVAVRPDLPQVYPSARAGAHP